jgi:hypothetical protein
MMAGTAHAARRTSRDARTARGCLSPTGSAKVDEGAREDYLGVVYPRALA